MVCGNWVRSFAEATHACVCDVNLDANWNYIDLRIVSIVGKKVFLSGYPDSVPIKRDRLGEYIVIENQCPFGVMVGKRFFRHKARPFLDKG